jgi:hypothetical protein
LDLRVYSFRSRQIAALNLEASVRSTNRGLNRLHTAYSQFIDRAKSIKPVEKENMREDLNDAKAILDENQAAIDNYTNNLKPSLLNASPADLNDKVGFLNQFKTSLDEISQRNYNALESLYNVGVQISVAKNERNEVKDIDIAYSEGEFVPGKRPKKATATISTLEGNKLYELRREKNSWVVVSSRDVQDQEAAQ